MNSPYFALIRSTCFLTIDEEQALAVRVQEGDREAVDELVRSFLPFVVQTAMGYRRKIRRFQGRGLDFDDLVSEGGLGLIRAAERFEPGRGRFVTFAAYWVHLTIRNAIANHRGTIRVPIRAQRKADKRMFADEPHEIETEGPRAQRETSEPDIPLVVFEDNDFALSEWVLDHQPPPETGTDLADEVELLRVAVELLEPRDREIIERRYGLAGQYSTDGEPETGKDIAKRLRIAPQTVSWIADVALSKLHTMMAE